MESFNTGIVLFWVFFGRWYNLIRTWRRLLILVMVGVEVHLKKEKTHGHANKDKNGIFSRGDLDVEFYCILKPSNPWLLFCLAKSDHSFTMCLIFYCWSTLLLFTLVPMRLIILWQADSKPWKLLIILLCTGKPWRHQAEVGLWTVTHSIQKMTLLFSLFVSYRIVWLFFLFYYLTALFVCPSFSLSAQYLESNYSWMVI